MDIRHLKIFVAVAETGSTTAAAKKMYISQPSVSLAIAEMESYYHVSLFHRNKRKLEINDSGSVLLEGARQILEQFNQLEMRMQAEKSHEILQVGMSAGMDFLLPICSRRYRELHPNEQLGMIISNSQTIRDKLESKELDLGVVVGNPQPELFCEHPLWQDDLLFICAPNHPLLAKKNVCFQDIAAYPLLMREKGCASRDQFDELCVQRKLRIAPLWESVAEEAIVHECANGDAISMLPSTALKAHLERGTVAVLPVSDARERRNVIITYLHKHQLSKKEQDFIAICTQATAQLNSQSYFPCVF